MASSHNVELEAAKFLNKVIQDSNDGPAKLATKLHLLLQHMKSAGKELLMSYQVISRAVEILINQHDLDIEALNSSRLPLCGGTQIGSSQAVGVAKVSRVGLAENEMPKMDPFTSGCAPVAPSIGAPDYYQGSMAHRSSLSFDRESPSCLNSRSANSQSQDRCDASNWDKQVNQKDGKKATSKRKRGGTSPVESHVDIPSQLDPRNTVYTMKGKMTKAEPSDGLPVKSGELTNFNMVLSSSQMEHFPALSGSMGTMHRGNQECRHLLEKQTDLTYIGKPVLCAPNFKYPEDTEVSSAHIASGKHQGAYAKVHGGTVVATSAHPMAEPVFSSSMQYGGALERDGGSSTTLADGHKIDQIGRQSSTSEMTMLRQGVPPRDTGKSRVSAVPESSAMPFKEQQNGLTPNKLHLEIALGTTFSREGKDLVDHEGKSQSSNELGNSSGIVMAFGCLNNGRQTDNNPSGSTSAGKNLEADSFSKGTESPRMMKDKGKLLMKRQGGRKRHDDVWKHVKKLNGDRVMCWHCKFEFAAPSATRISSHLYSIPNKGIRGCSNFGQAANGSSERDKNIARSCNLEVASRIASSTREDCKVNETRNGTTLQLQVDTKKKRISYQVGPFSISHDKYDELDIQLIQYVFDPSRNPSEEVVIFPHYHLKRSEFTTLGPEAFFNAMVIDVFAENLTKIEEEKMKIKPTRNWYLPLLFSQFALDSDESSCVERHNMKNDFMPSDLVNCDKIFIPIHIGPNSCGHFYLYVVHLKRKVVEIWDSLPSYTTEKERNEKTQKLLLVLDKLFENDKSKSWAFAKFSAKMAENIPKQSNSYDCGIFVIKFMKDSANAMNNKLFESDKERLDLALELLKSELNKERETLFNKAALWYYVPHKEYQQMEDANHSPSIVIPQGPFIDCNDLKIIRTEFDQVKSSGEEKNKGHALRMNSKWRTIEHEVAGLAGKHEVRKLEVEVANLKAKSEKEKADLLAKITALEAKSQEEASQLLNIKLEMEAKISSLTAQLDSVEAQWDSKDFDELLNQIPPDYLF